MSNIVKENFKLIIYLILWYFFSGYYNILNKNALNILKLPWFVATIQMGLGLFIFLPLWILKIRRFPVDSFDNFNKISYSLLPVAIYQSLTHASGVIALGAGAVSFTQVVKASEPAFTAVFSAFFLHKFLPWQVYSSLVLVILGVAMSSVTELTFSWHCFTAGIMANIFAAARGVFGKKQMSKNDDFEVNLDPENYYAILTIISFFLLVPITYINEGNKILEITKIANYEDGILNMFYSGLLFYLYNEISFRALNNISPISHAIANTFKRIVIIVTSVLFFGESIGPIGLIGTSTAILGVFLYSFLGILYENKEKSAI